MTDRPRSVRPTSRGRLETITQLFRGWVWESDVEHRFTYLSDSVQQLAGRPPEWHYGKTRAELGNVIADAAQQAEMERQVAEQAAFGPFEFRRHQNGDWFWMRTVGTPIFDATSRFVGYRGIAFDVTQEVAERRSHLATKDRLADTLSILQATVQGLSLGICVFDRDRCLAFANDAYFEMLDLPRDRFGIGSTFEAVVAFLAERGELGDGATRKQVEYHLKAVASGRLHGFERARPNGARLKINGIPLPDGGFVRTFADVTEAAELKRQLEEARRELRRLRLQQQRE